MTNGYVTAPQCAPSRAGLMTGMYQQRFGLDENASTPLPKGVSTVAEHFQNLGYRTGMVGKWHLEVFSDSQNWISSHCASNPSLSCESGKIPDELQPVYLPDARGFDEMFAAYANYAWTNRIDDSIVTPPKKIALKTDRIEKVNEEALQFIQRNRNTPFFLYIAPMAPHVPLAAAQTYLDRFPGDMPLRRKYALAMISAIDDGVGQIVDTSSKCELVDNTLIIFMSDNGAPLGGEIIDAPVSEVGEWDGSLNTPLHGEKGHAHRRRHSRSFYCALAQVHPRSQSAK